MRYTLSFIYSDIATHLSYRSIFFPTTVSLLPLLQTHGPLFM